MKKLCIALMLLVVSFALIGCTEEAKQQQEEIIEQIKDELPIYELDLTDVLVITATYPIWENNSIRNGSLYMHEFTGEQVSTVKIWANGMLEVTFTNGDVTYVYTYLSMDIS